MAFDVYPVTLREPEGEAVIFTAADAAELKATGWVDDLSTDFGIDDVVGLIGANGQATVVHNGEFVVKHGDKRQILTGEEVDAVYDLGDSTENTDAEAEVEAKAELQPVDFPAWGPADNDVELELDEHAAGHTEIPVEVKPGEGSDFNPPEGIGVPEEPENPADNMEQTVTPPDEGGQPQAGDGGGTTGDGEEDTEDPGPASSTDPPQPVVEQPPAEQQPPEEQPVEEQPAGPDDSFAVDPEVPTGGDDVTDTTTG